MENNSVILHGIVKRDAQSVCTSGSFYVLDFSVEVWNESAQRQDVFDCRTTNETEAYDNCQGYLNKGDCVTVEGILERRTSTSEGRIGGKTITLKSTDVIVFAEFIDDIERASDEY